MHKNYQTKILNKRFFLNNPILKKESLLFSAKILSKYDGIIKANGLFSVKLGEIVYVIKLDKKSVEFKKMYGLVFNLTKRIPLTWLKFLFTSVIKRIIELQT